MPERLQTDLLLALLDRPQASFQASVVAAFAAVAAHLGPRVVREAPLCVVLKADPQGRPQIYATVELLKVLLRVPANGRLSAALQIWQLDNPDFVDRQRRHLAAERRSATLPAAPRYLVPTPAKAPRSVRDRIGQAASAALRLRRKRLRD